MPEVTYASCCFCRTGMVEKLVPNVSGLDKHKTPSSAWIWEQCASCACFKLGQIMAQWILFWACMI